MFIYVLNYNVNSYSIYSCVRIMCVLFLYIYDIYLLLYYYIQDAAHNFDNIFISLGFFHKLTVFYDKNNPAECNEQHGFFYYIYTFFFANYYCRGLPEHNSNVTVSRANVTLSSL